MQSPLHGPACAEVEDGYKKTPEEELIITKNLFLLEWITRWSGFLCLITEDIHETETETYFMSRRDALRD